MKERLQNILTHNSWDIIEAVIHEIIDDESPMESLLYIQQYWVDGWLIECLEFEKDSIKFFNKYYKEIENIRQYLQNSWEDMTITWGYSNKAFFSALSFKHVAFNLYMDLIMEDL